MPHFKLQLEKKQQQQKNLLWAPAEYQQKLNNYVHFISQ